jgi:hypothetical protein
MFRLYAFLIASSKEITFATVECCCLLPPPKPQIPIIPPVYNIEVFAYDNTTAIAVLAV